MTTGRPRGLASCFGAAASRRSRSFPRSLATGRTAWKILQLATSLHEALPLLEELEKMVDELIQLAGEPGELSLDALSGCTLWMHSSITCGRNDATLFPAIYVRNRVV